MAGYIIEENGLKLKGICSPAPKRQQASWLEIKAGVERLFPEPAFAFALMDHAARLGLFGNEEFMFYDSLPLEFKFLHSLRVFNEKQELFIWRKNQDSFYYRLRVDEVEVGEDFVVDAHQLLWGTLKEKINNNEWLRLEEDRGIEIFLPACAVPETAKRVWLKTRNYIGYNEFSQAGYVDCRFVGFAEGRE